MLEHFALSFEDALLSCCRLGLALCVGPLCENIVARVLMPFLRSVLLQFLEGEFPRKP